MRKVPDAAPELGPEADVEPALPRDRSNVQTRLAASVLGLLAVAILGMWAFFLAQGFLSAGVVTIENNMLAIFHLTAECVMGLLLALAAWGVFAGRRWGAALALLAVGALIYSTLNSLGDTVRNKPNLTPILLVSLALGIASLGLLFPRRNRVVRWLGLEP